MQKDALAVVIQEQMQFLVERKTPFTIMSKLAEKGRKVIEMAEQCEHTDKILPALAVIPREWLTVYTQIEMLQGSTRIGFATLDPTKTTYVVPVPTEPYFILNVETGYAYPEWPGRDEMFMDLKKRKRLLLTDMEAIAFCAYGNLPRLKGGDNIDGGQKIDTLCAFNCRHEDDRTTIALTHLRTMPAVCTERVNYIDTHWNIASCSARV